MDMADKQTAYETVAHETVVHETVAHETVAHETATQTDRQVEILTKLIELVVRQTDLNYETAHKKLSENEWDYMKVIRKQIGIEPKVTKTCSSVNQEIYRQLRLKMDEAGNNIYPN